jgi:hypothetical protein
METKLRSSFEVVQELKSEMNEIRSSIEAYSPNAEIKEMLILVDGLQNLNN